MSDLERQEQLMALIAEVAGVDPAGLAPEQELVADLGIDSPKALRLLVEIEDRLGVEVDDADAAGMHTVGDVLAFAARYAG